MRASTGRFTCDYQPELDTFGPICGRQATVRARIETFTTLHFCAAHWERFSEELGGRVYISHVQAIAAPTPT